MSGKRKPVARMTIGREGNTIRLVFVCDDEYLAIKLYDELTAQSDAGQIGLSLNVGPQARSGE